MFLAADAEHPLTFYSPLWTDGKGGWRPDL